VSWAIFSGGRQELPADWTVASAGTIFGSMTLDASRTAGDQERSLKAFCLFGSVTLKVPAGVKIDTGGFAILGSTAVKVAPGDGPLIMVEAKVLFGSVEVVAA